MVVICDEYWLYRTFCIRRSDTSSPLSIFHPPADHRRISCSSPHGPALNFESFGDCVPTTRKEERWPI